jgi:N-acyl-phosphatidylethanolamine-hydrolysing phospholipase D
MKRMKLGIFGLLIGVMIQGCAHKNPYYDPDKPHHRPNGFVNSDGTTVSKPFSDLWKWYKERFGKDLPPPPGEFIASYDDFPLEMFNQDKLAQYGDKTMTWLGHASVLVRAEGFTVLTDPHFSERAFPVQWAGPARKVKSPATARDLPPVDVVVISHSHYDHMDYNTIMEIARLQPNALFLVPLGVELTLKEWGVNNVKAMDWWETHETRGQALTFVPAYHWSARSLTDRNTTLWGGWVFKNKSLSFYFSGDTGYSEDFKEIGKRYGPFDASAIAVGAYEPRWFMKAQHINPEEAVQIHQEVGSKYSIGVHWGTFELTDEPLDQPLGDLQKALAIKKVDPETFKMLKQGETVSLN